MLKFYEISEIIENLNRYPELHQILSNLLINLVNVFSLAYIRIASFFYTNVIAIQKWRRHFPAGWLYKDV